MFKIEKDNEKIGKYLSDLIRQKYKSQRAFCRDYITATGGDPNDKISVDLMANRLSQMINGKNAIQIDDLPIFTKLLSVTCEQILSAGDYSVPLVNRVTNYYIANSKKQAEWEEYINRADKLILNSDEYCKTVLDYALEFGNYKFLKYLMDNKYIWFDSGKDSDYVLNFGAGTSIKPRGVGSKDWGLQKELFEKDELRITLITLAVDNNDLEMLNDLRARENPQLYNISFYLRSTDISDFDSCYIERMVRHIASSGEEMLDYFTDPFEIHDKFKHKNGDRQHTFMFPYISKLLDLLISANSGFTETALKKALKHNKETYNRLCKVIRDVKNNEHVAEVYSYSINPSEQLKEVTIAACKNDLEFCENGDIVMFTSFNSRATTNCQVKEVIVTNVPRVTKKPASPILKHLAEELNESYGAIKNLKEHLEDI